MNLFLKILVIIIFSPGLAFSWELQSNEDNIKIYTKDVEGSEFKTFRGTAEIKSSLRNAIAHHLDIESMTQWLQDCSKSELVKRIDSNNFYLYQRTSAPWPVSDRDYVIRMNITQDPKDFSVLMTFEASVELTKSDEDCVPVTELKGYWRYTPKADNHIFVEFETAAEPSGNIPSWLANSFVVEQPLGTLTKLKQRVENNTYTMPEEMDYIVEPSFTDK